MSFQSTGATNIMMVNSTDEVSFFTRMKERGIGDNKHYRIIEDNDGRMIYIFGYGTIDNIDHYLRNAMVHVISWKWWFSAACHSYSLALVVAWDIYREVVEGKLDTRYYLPETDRLTFEQFRDLCSRAQLSYNPKKRLYPGDEYFTECTKENKRRRRIVKSTGTRATRPQVEEEMNAPETRLCGDLKALTAHAMSVTKNKDNHYRGCAVCGKPTYFTCGLCGKPTHFFNERPAKGVDLEQAKLCFLQLHDNGLFGLLCCDRKLFYTGDKRLDSFNMPSDEDIERNRLWISRITI